MGVASLVIGIITTIIGLFLPGHFWHIVGAAVAFLGISFSNAERRGREGIGIAIAGLVMSILGVVFNLLPYALYLFGILYRYIK